MIKFGKQIKVSLVSAFLATLFIVFIANNPIERIYIDTLNYFHKNQSQIDDVVVVGIDETSFQAMEMQWPWPREVHGELVNEISKFNPKSIVFDVVFSEPSNENSDNYFAEAISNAKKIVLASDLSIRENSFMSGVVETRPLELFEKAGALVGLAGVEADGDMVVRHFPPFENTLSEVAVGKNRTDSNDKKIIRYHGSSHSFKYISYFKFFMPEGVKKEDIEGKIVLIGLDVKASPDMSGSQKDAFPSPFTRFDAQLMPGVELHANLVSNIINDSAVSYKTDTFYIILLIINFLVITWVCSSWKPIASLVYGSGVCVAWMMIASYSWIDGSFINALSSVPIFLLTYIASGGHAYLTEGRQKKMIKGAFAQYLSPDMVDSLIEEPDKLKLGGEKRVMSIMFCDVRGFTAISEALKTKPEKLTEVINILLTYLSKDILDFKGTIDKYMGDCIMAFWNAPLINENHSEDAVESAKKMMLTMDEVNKEIQKSGDIDFDLKIGIGIGTGECVVGNMGSDQRFDYTVLGDVVNLSSRLEGQTKAYGVTTIISSNTFSKVGYNENIIELDRIQVKGKTEPETIFGLFSKPISSEEREVQDSFLDAYRSGNYAKSMQALNNLISLGKNLKNYALLIQKRIKIYEKKGFPENWDGIYTATDK